MILDPVNTTVGDLCGAALTECGAVGVGQTPLAADLNNAQFRLQAMLQQWQIKRWLIYHLVTYSMVATGAESYTIGPGGQMDTGLGSQRPNRIESAFVRQIQNAAPNQVDYPLRILQSNEDYNKIRLKSLVSFPRYVFMDTATPLANVYPWPVPNASTYSLFLTVREQLPQAFSLAGNPLAVAMNIPFEYYRALVKNIAMEVRPKYGIANTPGDILQAQARDSLETIRRSNTQIPLLSMPPGLAPRPGMYNIYSDQSNAS